MNMEWEEEDSSEYVSLQSLVKDLIFYENHYNSIQNKYKKLSLTWVVATFFAMGYLISGYESGVHLNILLSIAFLCFLSAMGIFLLWYLDSGVYHKILEAIFFEVVELEKKYPKILGSSHQNMIKLHYLDEEPHGIHGAFYSGFILFLLTISASCLDFYVYNFSFWGGIAISAFIAAGWIVFFVLSKRALLANHPKD